MPLDNRGRMKASDEQKKGDGQKVFADGIFIPDFRTDQLQRRLIATKSEGESTPEREEREQTGNSTCCQHRM